MSNTRQTNKALPKVVVRTNSPAFGAAIGRRLYQKGVGTVTIQPCRGGEYGLRLLDDPEDGTWAYDLVGALAPLNPPMEETGAGEGDPDELPPGTAAILQIPDWPTGDKFPELSLEVNSAAMSDAARRILAPIPHSKMELKSVHAEQSEVAPSSASLPRMFSEMAGFLLGCEGIEANVLTADPGEERSWRSPSIRVRVADPALVKTPMVSRYRVILRSDREYLASALAAKLSASGFSVLVGSPLMHGELCDHSINLDPGLFGENEFRDLLKAIKRDVTEACSAAGIDMARYPVQTNRVSRGESFDAYLDVPAGACLAGLARSTGGDFADKFNVRIETDQPGSPVISALCENLVAAGFRRPDLGTVQSPVGSSSPEPLSNGMVLDFRLVMGSLQFAPECLAKVRSLLANARAELDPAETLRLSEETCWRDHDNDVLLRVPVLGSTDGSLSDLLQKPSCYPVKLIAEDPEVWDDLAEALEKAGFRIMERDSSATEETKITFGAAPEEVVRLVAGIVRSGSGTKPAIHDGFHALDPDIYIHLPAKPVRRKKKARPEPRAVAPAVVATSDEPFLSADASGLTIAGIRLERRFSCDHPGMVPQGQQFAHFCVDQCAAETLGHLALSVRLGEPCLLEGETSTAKTSSILYLASLLGQPVVRVNLNGQTDTGELVGRFVPATGSRAGGGAQWAWQDGVLLEALRHGWWVILDELNLAEPAILERLNSLLERDPSLLVTEHDNRVFGPGGEPIHPEFRIFGTMNPAEYAGRNVLSPAYRDRWRGHLIVRPAGESEYRAMLRRMVFGESPDLCVEGILYESPGPSPGGATHPVLAGQPGMDGFLDALARFQAGLDSAGRSGHGSGEPGPGRKEKPVFTRRGLIALLDHLASPAHAGRRLEPGRIRAEAIRRYFLSRLTGEEAGVALRLMQASGLDSKGICK